MQNLAILDEARTFPPKRIWLVVWILTLLFALLAIVAAIQTGGHAWIFWGLVAVAALSQIWSTRWVQVDNESIRTRNIFQRGRQMRWDTITSVREEELPLRKKPYVIIRISDAATPPARRATRMKITSDIEGFDLLRGLIRELAPVGRRVIGDDDI